MFGRVDTVISVGATIRGLATYQLTPFSWKTWVAAGENPTELRGESRIRSFGKKPVVQFRRTVTIAMGGNAAVSFVERRRRGAPDEAS